MITLTCYVQPGARQTEVVGHHGEHLKIRLKAPPVDGKANQALIDFIAEAFGTRSSAITLVRGAKSRLKTLHIPQPQTIPAWYTSSTLDGATSHVTTL